MKNIKNKIVRKKICYCRVSSIGQKEDLERQVNYMKKHYPTYEIIKDIASGLNFKRKGLNKIIKEAISGEIEEIVVAYKDRLSRFGYDLIELLVVEYSKGKITVLNKREINSQEEIMEDLMQIMNVYVAKINGSRKYSKNIKKNV